VVLAVACSQKEAPKESLVILQRKWEPLAECEVGEGRPRGLGFHSSHHIAEAKVDVETSERGEIHHESYFSRRSIAPCYQPGVPL